MFSANKSKNSKQGTPMTRPVVTMNFDTFSQLQEMVSSKDAVLVYVGHSKPLCIPKMTLMNIATYFASVIPVEEKKHKQAKINSPISIDLLKVCDNEHALRKWLLLSLFEKCHICNLSLDTKEIFALFPLVERLGLHPKYRKWILGNLQTHLDDGKIEQVIQWVVKTAEKCTTFKEGMAIFSWAFQAMRSSKREADTLSQSSHPNEPGSVFCQNCSEWDNCQPHYCSKTAQYATNGEPVYNVIFKLVVPAIWLKRCLENKMYVNIPEMASELYLERLALQDYEQILHIDKCLASLRPFVIQLLSFQMGSVGCY
jgi:hypothetical protein